MSTRVRLGELLVEAKILSQEQLDDALARQAEDGRRLGTILVEAGIIGEGQLTQILSQQLSVPWVSLFHVDFSRSLLDLVSRPVAEAHCLIPIFVRRIRGYGETLYVAMDDPTDEHALEVVARDSGLHVRAMIASTSQIVSAIRAYYGGHSIPPGERRRSVRSSESPDVDMPAIPRAPAVPAVDPALHHISSVPPDILEPLSSAPPPRSGAPAAPKPAEGEEAMDARSLPPNRKRGGRQLVTITLLDGTEVRLPHPQRKQRGTAGAGDPEVDGQLTTGDLVLALRAMAQGADGVEELGTAVSWEMLLATLLSLLMKKHLIADWEFIAELQEQLAANGAVLPPPSSRRSPG